MEQYKPEKNNNEPKKIAEWKDYYEVYKDAPHSKSLERAVTLYCEQKGDALDIGAGNLRDTKYLLQEGFTVTAVDTSEESQEYGKALNNPSLTMVKDKIGNWGFPPNHYSVINAQGTLFHFYRDIFDSLIKRIKSSLAPGGVFCGDFLGPNDDWKECVLLTKEEIISLFDGFDIKMIREVENDSSLPIDIKNGIDKPKHWHSFHVIAKKNED